MFLYHKSLLILKISLAFTTKSILYCSHQYFSDIVKMTNNDNQRDTVLELTVQLGAAYISNPNNKVDIANIGEFLKSISAAIHQLSIETRLEQKRPVTHKSISVEDSVHDDYIICLEDGKKLQMLKRHLNTVYGMTLTQYKERWNLPTDYPVVAPNYARRRSQIAKSAGFGSSRKKKKVA